MAKREYSAEFTNAMDAEFSKIIPKDILDMKLVDYVKKMEEQNNVETAIEAEQSSIASKFKHPVKLLSTAKGIQKIPACITPRVNNIGHPRPSKFGELLFSVRGTPVISTSGASASAKRREAVIQSLLQEEDSTLTPETRNIIGKLKELVNKREEQIPRLNHIYRKNILALENDKQEQYK
ncbi:hypothetical protein Mgra_00003676 [Meloidogyne graminicola]|uniref:Uncharacterized protein n=1 Tax=Meloidogyne graminicola TaxID=189291 RepID=A0A8S9ZUI3_9BILA|nr:hypothetical protein Mgra_00003676 [Meloidogyne graminicola]